MSWWIWVTSALAQPLAEGAPCPSPFTAEQVREVVAQSTEALLQDDALGHRRRWEEFAERVGCLDHQVAEDQLARLLLNEALVRKATGKDWQRPLDTARRACPAQETPAFLLQEFRPLPDPPDTGLPVPEDGVLFLDGVLSPLVPLLEGEHVAQLWRDRRWRSAWLGPGEQIPADWLLPKPREVVEVVREEAAYVPRSLGTVGFGLGGSLGRQMVDQPAQALGDQEQYGGWLALVSAGAAPLAGNGGVGWDVTLPVLVPSVRRGTDEGYQADPAAVLPLGFVTAAAVFEDAVIGLGGGVSSLLHYEAEEPVLVVYPQPHLSLGLREGRRDFEVSGGLTPAALHAGLRGGYLLGDPRAWSPRFGVDTQLGVGWFEEASPGERRATALQWSLLLRLDAAWGRDR